MHKWDSAIEGNENFIMREWSKQLSGLTGNDIKRGLENWVEDWPPSSAEFKKACMQIKHAAIYHKEYISIKCLESDSEKANRKAKGLTEIEKIRKSIQ